MFFLKVLALVPILQLRDLGKSFKNKKIPRNWVEIYNGRLLDEVDGAGSFTGLPQEENVLTKCAGFPSKVPQREDYCETR